MSEERDIVYVVKWFFQDNPFFEEGVLSLHKTKEGAIEACKRYNTTQGDKDNWADYTAEFVHG